MNTIISLTGNRAEIPINGLRRLSLKIFLLPILVCFLLTSGLAMAAPAQVIFYTDWTLRPGHVFYLGGNTERSFFHAPKGSLYSVAFSPDGVLYYCNANDNKLFRWIGDKPYLVYQHTTYIRDVAFDKLGRLYFSEASGAGADGTIYRMKEDGVLEKYLNVPLNKVDGYWSGDFAFSPNGDLYISSGNRIPAMIYKVDVRNNKFYEKYRKNSGAIAGFDFDVAGNIYYANWSKRIYKLDTSGPTWQESVVREDTGRYFANVTVLKGGSIALGPEAGRVNTVALHPTNSNILYAGTDSGGVYRSYDEGKTWYGRSTGISDPRLGDVFVDPNNPSVVLAVTPSGIFRSVNEGLTWSQVLNVKLPLPPPYWYSQPIRGLDTLFEMKKGPIHFDGSNGSIYAAPLCAGLYKSTDRGKTWKQVYGTGLNIAERCVTSIDISPENGGTVFITTPKGIMTSTNGGTSWKRTATEISVQGANSWSRYAPVYLQVSPSNPNRIYVTAFDLYTTPFKSNVWRRDAKGGKFAPTVTGKPPWLSWFNLRPLAIHPKKDNIVWAGGVAELYKSSNAGGLWSRFRCNDSTICGVDYRGLRFDSRKGSLFAAHDQGIYRYDMNSNAYKAVELGIANTQFHDLDVGPAGTIYGATQDKDGFKKEGNKPWVVMPWGGDVLDVLVDPTDDKHVFIRDNSSAELFLSSDGGSTKHRSSGLPDAPGFWNHQMVYVPTQKTVYATAANRGVYKSTDDGKTFSPANKGIEKRNIRCLTNQPGSNSLVFAGTMNDGIYKTTNGGTSWNKLSNFPASGALVLAVDKSGLQVYAGTIKGVYYSSDGGKNWTLRSKGLPPVKVVSELVIDPKNPKRLLAGLGFYLGLATYGGGAYESVDGGKNWTALLSKGERYMTVTSIRIDPSDRSRLYIATYGSGIRVLFRSL
ncbi:MAG: hypothetical protein GY800_13595 [Planctomycetes bacterium]|nr:hypothetical protein [Planctomycetota bacterium]